MYEKKEPSVAGVGEERVREGKEKEHRYWLRSERIKQVYSKNGA